MEPFFTANQRFPTISIALEDILPAETTSALAKERAVYQYYVNAIAALPSDEALRPFRYKALMGSLTPPDFENMHSLFHTVQSQAQRTRQAVTPQHSTYTVSAYAHLNSYAMLLAQILFVDNSIKEGLPDQIEDAARVTVCAGLAASIRDISAKNGAKVAADEARFYATLFLLQTAFDKLFVPNENIVIYDTQSGAYHVTDLYEKCISYLALSGRKIATASRAEKDLCYDLTTGWGDHIDLATWNALNTHYYSAISPTTGKENLFTKHYDLLLERMLPQFALSKVKLAEEVLKSKKDGETLKILEIGAGSGALAIDLVMACTRCGLSPEEIIYAGIEPSAYMRRNFRTNCERKIGAASLPTHWTLLEGSMEQVDAFPTQYIDAAIVCSFSLHHCFHESVKRFFRNRTIKHLAQSVFVLEATAAHGWTKPYYMWADCESPENFDNVLENGLWTPQTVWSEPAMALEAHSSDHAWCSLQIRT
jgi:hypothetical protein